MSLREELDGLGELRGSIAISSVSVGIQLDSCGKRISYASIIERVSVPSE